MLYGSIVACAYVLVTAHGMIPPTVTKNILQHLEMILGGISCLGDSDPHYYFAPPSLVDLEAAMASRADLSPTIWRTNLIKATTVS